MSNSEAQHDLDQHDIATMFDGCHNCKHHGRPWEDHCAPSGCLDAVNENPGWEKTDELPTRYWPIKEGQ